MPSDLTAVENSEMQNMSCYSVILDVVDYVFQIYTTSRSTVFWYKAWFKFSLRHICFQFSLPPPHILFGDFQSRIQRAQSWVAKHSSKESPVYWGDDLVSIKLTITVVGEEISDVNFSTLGDARTTVDAVDPVDSLQSIARNSAHQGFLGGAKLIQQLFHLSLIFEYRHQISLPIFIYTFHMLAAKYRCQCLSHTLLPDAGLCDVEELLLCQARAVAVVVSWGAVVKHISARYLRRVVLEQCAADEQCFQQSAKAGKENWKSWRPGQHLTAQCPQLFLNLGDRGIQKSFLLELYEHLVTIDYGIQH